MVGWHHRLDGQESEPAPGDGEAQGSLSCYSPWGRERVRRNCATELNCLTILEPQLQIILEVVYFSNSILLKKSLSRFFSIQKKQYATKSHEVKCFIF